MKASDLLNENVVKLALQAQDKKGVLEEMVSLLVRACGLQKEQEIIKAVIKREAQFSTAVGHESAFPHAQIPFLERTYMAFGRIPQGMAFDARDGKSVRYVFLIIGPEKDTHGHLMLLASLSRQILRPATRDALANAKTPQDVLEVFKEE